MKRQRKTALFQRDLVNEALKQSFIKLNPKILFRNPVMFTVEVGTVVMTFFTLKYVQLQSVRAALSQILTSKTVEIALDVPSGNALIVFGFALLQIVSVSLTAATRS